MSGTGTHNAIDQLIIRPATPADAERMIAHVHAMAYDAPDTLPMLPGEFDVTVEQERELLTKLAATGTGVFLLAVVNDEIAGLAHCFCGKRMATRHAATLGISIRKKWQGKGIGTKLMQAIIDWAKQTGVVTRIELLVYADNARAIRLYEKMGFVHEGRHRNAVKRNGTYVDDFVMALIW